MRTRSTFKIAALLLFLGFCANYLPDVGHGFIRDDVGWIQQTDLLQARGGVFRPAVVATFAAERSVCGISPFCHDLTNFLLAIACAIAVAILARSLGLGWSASLVATAIWIFNWHGISSAVLWISGRTALLLVLFAALSASEFVRGRWLTAALLAGAAMLSKEEAVLLPATLLAWAGIDWLLARKPIFTMRNIGFGVAAAAAGAGYLLLRQRSGAFTAASAPAFYRLEISTRLLTKNIPEYMDRSLTFTAVVLLLFWLVNRASIHTAWGSHRRLFWYAVAWWIGGFAITMFIPVRSSLYACAPSLGFAVLAAELLHEWWLQLDEKRRTLVIRAGLAIPFLLWPVYHFRNKDLVDATDVSARTMTALQRVADERGANTVVVIEDDRSKRASVDTALGTGVQEAVDFVVKPRVLVWLDPPPSDAALGGIAAAPAKRDVTLRLTNGELVRTLH